MASPSSASAQYKPFVAKGTPTKTTTTTATTTVPKHTAGPRELPYTGYNLQLGISIGIILVLFGLFLVLAAKRFRRPPAR